MVYFVEVVTSSWMLPLKHMDAVMRILRYLKATPGKGLLFSKNNHLHIEGYTDVDWLVHWLTKYQLAATAPVLEVIW